MPIPNSGYIFPEGRTVLFVPKPGSFRVHSVRQDEAFAVHLGAVTHDGWLRGKAGDYLVHDVDEQRNLSSARVVDAATFAANFRWVPGDPGIADKTGPILATAHRGASVWLSTPEGACLVSDGNAVVGHVLTLDMWLPSRDRIEAKYRLATRQEIAEYHAYREAHPDRDLPVRLAASLDGPNIIQ